MTDPNTTPEQKPSTSAPAAGTPGTGPGLPPVPPPPPALPRRSEQPRTP